MAYDVSLFRLSSNISQLQAGMLACSRAPELACCTQDPMRFSVVLQYSKILQTTLNEAPAAGLWFGLDVG